MKPPSLTARFIMGSKFGWWTMFWIYNIDRPRKAYRHFKRCYPWIVCERVK